MKETKAALIFGTFMAVMHTIWSLMVFLGFAQNYVNWILGLHFLNNPFRVGAFSFGRALTLIGATFVVGYIVGYIFATIWNKLNKRG
ncbi:hypothetical protein HY503_01680 [Candidatus Woesebacteria bacterium]|nr:hypothetical protein [Candidatus Woesebacteria bacterium]